MVRVIPQQRERAVIFRDSCRPERAGLFELQRRVAGIVFPEAVLFARGQLDFRRQIRIRLPESSSLSDLAQDFFCWDLNGNGVGASEKHGYSFRPH